MKFFSSLLFTSFLGWFIIGPVQNGTTTQSAEKITGIIKDAVSSASLNQVAVEAFNASGSVGKTQTNAEGKFELNLPAGTYTVLIALKGYEQRRWLEVVLSAGQTLIFDQILQPVGEMEEIVTAKWSTHRPFEGERALSEALDGAVSGYGISSDDRGMSSVKEVAPAKMMAPPPPVAKMRAPASPPAYDRVASEPSVLEEVVVTERRTEMRKSTDASTAKTARSPEKATSDKKKAPVSVKEDKLPGKPSPSLNPQPAPKAGLLTAGEWNDLDNWARHWTDLLADGEIAGFQKTYEMYPKERYTVLLQNKKGFPLIDVPVQLKTPAGVTLWEARTDNTGKAEMWHAFFEKEQKTIPVHIHLTWKGENKDMGSAIAYSKGINLFQLDQPCESPNNVDIVWCVDATGSMGDEIQYLKTELLDVVERVKTSNPTMFLRMGTVFYRDTEDEYLVKGSGLHADIDKTVHFIQKQNAGGGGDYPEAVHSALEEAIFNQKWSPNAVARICFLVLDASPHQTPEVNASLQKTITEAARRGIRIVPISASGVQKDTEFLMKFFGLATNGSYIFLTDHSGIGNGHIEATTDTYKVELLNDLLCRLIGQYIAVPTCEGKSILRFEGTPQDSTNQAQQGPLAFFYPNPATTQFTLDLPFEATKVTLYDAEGRAVQSFAKLSMGQHKIKVSDLPAGVYTLRIWKDNEVQTGKVMVIRA